MRLTIVMVVFFLFFIIVSSLIGTGSQAFAGLPVLSPGSSDKTPASDSNPGRYRVIVTLEESSEMKMAKNARGLDSKIGRQMQAKRAKKIRDQVLEKFPAARRNMIKEFSFTPSFAAQLTQDAIARLERMDGVVSVETDRRVYCHTAQGFSVMNALNVQSAYSGQGVGVAIIDTGIDYTHPALGESSSSTDFPNDKVLGGYDYGDGDKYPMDLYGHGTSCAGIAAGNAVQNGNYAGGVASGAGLYALKVSSGSAGSAYDSAIISAIEWCIGNKETNTAFPIKVISISMGGGGYASACDNTALSQTAANAVSAGITIFASSGNDGYCSKIASPACASAVISVGAVYDANIGGVGFCVDETSCADNLEAYSSCSTGYVAWSYTTAADMVAPYTNMSDDLELLAPSHNASTTDLEESYVTGFGGTSAACPYAAGMAAVMQSAQKSAHDEFLTPAQIRARMIAGGDNVTYSPAGITTARVNLGNTDIDGDGLPSDWEITWFGTIENDADTDVDEDGLTQAQEYENNTDPTLSDTDQDGMPDGWEVEKGLDPLVDDGADDADGDTYTNLEEYQAGTDPGDAGNYPFPVPAAGRLFWILSFGLLSGMGIKIIQKIKGTKN